jgi:hypothetical protein
MSSQPVIMTVNDNQTLKLIANGAVVIDDTEDLSLKPTYHALIINGKLAHMVSLISGETLFKKPELMTIFEDFINLLNSHLEN